MAAHVPGLRTVSGGAGRIYHDRNGEPLLIREYGADDREHLQRFYEGFEPKRAAQGLPPEDAPKIRKWLAAVLPNGLHLVVLRDGRLIGHALIMPSAREGIGEYAVFLHQDLRGRGVGSELSRAGVDAAKRAGLRGLWLTVDPANRAAVRSYERAGFRFRPTTIFSVEAEMELAW